MFTVMIALVTIFILLNVHVGAILAKRHGKWQFGILNWGAAILLGFTVLDKLIL